MRRSQAGFCNHVSAALILTIFAFVLDVICSLSPWWAVWLARPGTPNHRHDGLFADCGDPSWWVDCRFYNSGKFLKTPAWLFSCQLAALFSVIIIFTCIVLLIMEYTRLYNITRTKACAWLLLIAGLIIVAQVSVYGAAGAWFYGIRFTDMGNNINDRVFGWSFYCQLPTGPVLLTASALLFKWLGNRETQFERV